MKRSAPPSRYIVFFSLAIGLCAADLASKSWVFAWLGMPGQDARIWWLWEGVFGFQTSLNEGALFGFGQGLTMLFAALAVAALVGILIWLFAAGAAQDWLLTVALGFVTAGILGNLYDRLGFPGLVWPKGWPGQRAGEPVYAVRDFILMRFGDWSWPNYNLADSALVCGAALLLWHSFFSKPVEQPQDRS